MVSFGFLNTRFKEKPDRLFGLSKRSKIGDLRPESKILELHGFYFGRFNEFFIYFNATILELGNNFVRLPKSFKKAISVISLKIR